MAYAREIFIWIKNVIGFQRADKEADSHYSVLGNTLVRVSNHCAWMKIWDNYLQKNPQDEKRDILSLVFEDGEDTYTEECLFTISQRKKPIKVTEYVFKSTSLSKQDVKMIIGSLQQMMTTNKFSEPTGKGERFDRISVNPDFMNIETTANGRAIPAGGHGMDYSIEESKTNKNMKKNIVTISENTLRQIVSESVKKALNENYNQDIVDDAIQAIFSIREKVSKAATQVGFNPGQGNDEVSKLIKQISTLMYRLDRTVNSDYYDSFYSGQD